MTTGTPSLRRLSFVLFAVAVLVAAACGGDDGEAGSTTDSDGRGGVFTMMGHFVLESYTGPAGTVGAPEGSEAVLTLNGDTFNAETGCNILNGTFDTSAPPAITFELGPMTMRACNDLAIEAQERALVAGLPLVSDFELEDDALTLLDEAGDVLFTFVSGLPGLEGTSWTVTGVNAGDALVGTALTGALTAEFASDGSTLSGDGGCNRFNGTFSTEGDTISITDISTTLMACEPDVATLEQQYTAALEAPSTFELAGNVLTLRDADGAMQVTFELTTPS